MVIFLRVVLKLENYSSFFFLLLDSNGEWCLHFLSSTNYVQSGLFRITPCEIRCINIVLDSFSTGYLSLPCIFFPWGVHLRATLGILMWDHPRWRLLIIVWVGSEFILSCNSKFKMVLSQKIRQNLRMHPLWNVSILWKSVSIPCQHSDLYNSTDLTILL